MLTLTETARSVVSTIAERQQPDAEEAGMRISPSPDGAFAVAAVAAGEPGDEVVTSGSARVYLDQAASEVLNDKVLDAEVSPEGAVSFQLAPQPA